MVYLIMGLNRFLKNFIISLTFTLMIITLGGFLMLILPFTSLQKILVFLILLTGYLIIEVFLYRAILIKKHVSVKNENFKRSLLNQISPVHEEETNKEKKIKEVESKPIQNKTKYQYLGSTETRKYHLSNCRFSKLIKSPYRLESNDESFFKKKKFKPCKTCIKTKKTKPKMNL